MIDDYERLRNPQALAEQQQAAQSNLPDINPLFSARNGLESILDDMAAAEDPDYIPSPARRKSTRTSKRAQPPRVQFQEQEEIAADDSASTAPLAAPTSAAATPTAAAPPATTPTMRTGLRNRGNIRRPLRLQ